MSQRILSENQILAARENGRKSLGPVTDRGKAASARNAIRHGILSDTVVLENESAEGFADLLTALYAHFEPASEIECALVENMAVCRWRQMRLWAMEKAGLTFEIRKQVTENTATAAEDPPTRTALAFRVLCDQSRSFDVLNRYETRFDRQYNRALQRLTEMREKRKK